LHLFWLTAWVYVLHSNSQPRRTAMNPDELFEAAMADPTLWEGYEKWLNDQYEDDFDTRADYLAHQWSHE